MTAPLRRSASVLAAVSAALLLTLAIGTPLAAGRHTLTADRTRYAEACDGSAAIGIGDQTFIVAHDDDNILRGYKEGTAAPIFSESLVSFIGKKKEVDIEGVAQIDGLIYWIGSHGRDSGGDVEPTRLTLFAIRLMPPGSTPALKTEGKPYKGLSETFLKPLLTKLGHGNAGDLPPESPGALNIEGLAATPEKTLLIAFRNPLHEKQALVAELLNPGEVIADDQARAELGRVFELDLGGRGIRSIELISAAAGYLIVAGPFDSGASLGGKDLFAIYRWRSLDSPPRVERVTGLDLSSLEEFRPESLYLASKPGVSPATWALLSDDGDTVVGGVTCKKLAETDRRFKRVTFTLN